MADEINKEILEEEKKQTGVLKDVTAETAKVNEGTEKVGQNIKKLENQTAKASKNQIEGSKESQSQGKSIAVAEAKREKKKASLKAKEDATMFDLLEELGKGFQGVAKGLAPVGDALKEDFNKLLGPISLGLEAIPGFSTLQAIGNGILKGSFAFAKKNAKKAYERAKKERADDLKRIKQQEARARRGKKDVKGKEPAGIEAGGLFGPLIRMLKGIAAFLIAPFVAVSAFLTGTFGAVADDVSRLSKFIKGKFPKSIAKLTNLFKGFTSFFNTKVTGPLAKKLPKTTKLVTKGVQFFQRMFRTLSGFFGSIMKPLNAFIKGSRMLTGVSTVFKMLGRIFYPITLLFGAFKGIRTAIDDVGAQEGGIFSKIVAGIIGFAKGFFGFVVGGLLDAIKGAFAFILDKIGLTSAADFLKSFNFTELIGKAFDGIKNAILGIANFITNFVPAIFAGLAAAGSNLFSSPFESFKEAFSARLNQGGGGADAGGEGDSAAADIVNVSGDTGTAIDEGTTANEGERSGISRRDRDSRGNLINTVVNNSNVNNSNTYNPESTSTSDQAYSAAGD